MLQYLMTYLQSLMRDEEGQDLIEYALIVIVLVLVAIVGMAAVGDEIALLWGTIVTALGGV